MTPSTGPEPPRPAARPATFVRRVGIRNYKSIGKADLTLSPLTILVGRNGSGKSNFLDALRFVADGLQTSLNQAFQARGGAKAVFRRVQGISTSLAIDLALSLSGGKTAEYAFVLLPRRGSFVVQKESLLVRSGGDSSFYEVRKGRVERSSLENPPPVSEDRLYLVNSSGFTPFREVYEALTSMGFYNLNPDVMREPQNPDAGEILHRDGSNITSVIRRLRRSAPQVMSRAESYLAAIVPDVEKIRSVGLGPRETLVFEQRVSAAPTKFYAASMSDGTLRAVGILIAIAQLSARKGSITLVGIEEPETSLHPAATGALMDALREAASHTQIIVTSHSPDLIDQVELESETLLAVVFEEGKTRIAPLDEASLQAIREHLYTPGELLRMNQLEPNQNDLARQEQRQLFEDEGWAG